MPQKSPNSSIFFEIFSSFSLGFSTGYKGKNLDFNSKRTLFSPLVPVPEEIEEKKSSLNLQKFFAG